MEIKTKYDIGQHIWVVYEDTGIVCAYDDYIGWITYEDDLVYGLKESCNDLSEEEIISYEDTDTLVERIKQLMQEIREKELIAEQN